MANKKANRLLELGLNPVLLGNSGDNLKRPQLKGWQTAVITAEDVATWPARNNIGVRCGKTRQNGRYLLVFDFDYEAQRIFPLWRAEAEKAINKPLVVVTSGKGYHAYFYTTAEQVGRKLAMSASGETLIETIGRRRQVVTPGSVHPSGKRYSFASEAKYQDIPTVSSEQLALLVGVAERFDQRPPKPMVKRVAGDACELATGTGELAGLSSCLDYALQHINSVTQTEPDGQIRIMGQGGLIVTQDGRGWYCHSESIGGGLADLVAWHKGITVGAALDMLRPATNFSLYPGEHNTTIKLHSGQFLGDVDNINLPKHTYLKANTGSGKTTYAISLEGNVLLVVPTVAILQQLQHKHGAAVYHHDEKSVQGDERLVITTPDSLPHVLKLIDSSLYTLVVDEAHNIAVAGYRKPAYDNVVRTLDGAWQRVILMTGTPLPLVTSNLEIFESVAVQSPIRTQKAQRVSYGKGGKLDAIVDRIPQNGRSLVFLNDKREQLHQLVFKLKARGFISDQIAVINSDTRESSDYRLLVENEQVDDMTRVLICTSVISEGFNIRSEFDTVHIASYSSSIEAQQVVNRFRAAAPGIVYWYNNGEGPGKQLTIGRYARQILGDALTLSDSLNTNPEIDLDSDDVFAKELTRARFKSVSKLDSAQIIERFEDELTGEVFYQPSPVGVNHAVYNFLQKSENNHPELFKRNTAVYGWQWLADVTAAGVAGDAAAAKDYAAEKIEEENTHNEFVVEGIRKQGRDVLQHNIRHGLGDGDYFRLGKAVLKFADLLHDFDAACDAAIVTGGKTRATNTMARRLDYQIARGKGMPHSLIVDAFYMIFAEGERLTPDDIRQRVEAVLCSDSVTRDFIVPFTAGGRSPIDERKAVSILGDYFELKRCKIATDDGERVNGYELVSDVPCVNSVSLKSILLGQNTKFSETIPGFDIQNELVTA